MRVRILRVMVGLLTLGIPLGGYASDGVLEINQACAITGGCFPGDTAGFPITINQSGSYQLTGNLDLTAEAPSVPAVIISAPAVSFNLGGFEMRGPTTCSGSGPTLACSPEDPSGYGILIEDTAPGSSLRNGTVRGFATQGITSNAKGTRVSDITAFHNESDGIAFQEYGIITNCVSFENGSDGIDVDAGSVVDGVTSFGNGLDGIEVDGPSAVVTRSTATGNGAAGFNLAVGSKFGINTSRNNAAEDTCGGGICTTQRRYYLTPDRAYDGAAAPAACAIGFHMASFWEIRETTLLAYDSMLGFTRPDSGLGPPSPISGWVRTGKTNTIDTCSAYVSNSDQSTGLVVSLPELSSLSDPSDIVSPWSHFYGSCDFEHRVWCIED